MDSTNDAARQKRISSILDRYEKNIKNTKMFRNNEKSADSYELRGQAHNGYYTRVSRRQYMGNSKG